MGVRLVNVTFAVLNIVLIPLLFQLQTVPWLNMVACLMAAIVGLWGAIEGSRR